MTECRKVKLYACIEVLFFIFNVYITDIFGYLHIVIKQMSTNIFKIISVSIVAIIVTIYKVHTSKKTKSK